MLERLQSEKKITQKDFQDILYSLQIASGNASGVGKMKGILERLKQTPIKIMEQNIHDKYQLAKLIQSIDQYIDITKDQDFKDFF